MAENKLGKAYDFKGKKALVMGLGLHGGGVGTVKFLARKKALITVTDLRGKKDLLPSLRLLKGIKSIRYVLGQHREKDFLSVDLIIKNPGIRLDNPYLQKAKSAGVPITTDVEIFFNQCPAPIIGITGTRGKSTTSALVATFLEHKFPHVYLGGNIRRSVLDFLGRIKSGDAVVLELSSFQLADLARELISPHIAVVTNIMRDHLNWHRTMDEYINAKSAISRFQKKEDYLFLNPDDPILRKIGQKSPGKVIFPKIPKKFQEIVDKKFGAHFRSSIGLAIAIAKHYDVSDSAIKKELEIFKSLEGRQEIVAKIKGVTFINDTTATIPDAAIAALKRFSYQIRKGGKIILIAGGSDKKLEFGEFVHAVNMHAGMVILLPGKATSRIRNQESGIKRKTPEAQSMKEAVTLAWKSASPGDIILLSPGAASFGLFLNEFDRGKQFVREVRNIRDVTGRNYEK